MFPAMPVQGNKQERKIIKLFKSLNAVDQEALLAFAEFLLSRSEKGEQKVEAESPTFPIKPLDISRPEQESVVKAIKRLTATYPMVNKENILHPISGLMTSHIMQGKDAVTVIDELEELFVNEYKKTKNNED